MNARSQRICAWAGPVCAVTWVVGFFFLAGFIPPPAPSMDAHQIATMFAQHGGRIRAGLIIVGFGGAITPVGGHDKVAAMKEFWRRYASSVWAPFSC